jgi:hypothetical protein
MAPEREAIGMEAPAVAVKPLLVVALVLVLGFAASLAGMGWFYATYGPERAAPQERWVAARNIQEDERAQRMRLEAEQGARLARGRVPIERAMDMIIARGAEAYAPISAQPKGAPR